MQYDLIIKNGTVIDGSGMPRFRSDVGIVDGKIASIGRIRDARKRQSTPRATSSPPALLMATPIWMPKSTWDPLGTCSCWHGITSVVMGNCGFSLAPCKESEKDMVMRNLERAEDIAPRP